MLKRFGISSIFSFFEKKTHSGKKYRLPAKGYLGPIGDDLPSLIPIIIGLITFFSAFTFTLNEFNTRSTAFAADRDTLIIANSLKGDSYLSSFGEFDDACRGIGRRGIAFIGMVVSADQFDIISNEAANNVNYPTLSLVHDHLYSLEGKPLECQSATEPMTTDDLAIVLQNKPFVALSFPLALETGLAVVPGTLVVISWQA